MADPLSLLRDFNINKKLDKIRADGDAVNFDGMYMFAKKSDTAFRSLKNHCTLEMVLHVLHTRDLGQAEYLKQSQAAGLDTLTYVDRTKLLKFLDGELDLQLEPSAALPAAIVLDSSIQLGDQPEAKRQKTDGTSGLPEERYTRQLRDRNSMLLAHGDKKFALVLDIANREHARLSSLLKQQAQADAHRSKQQQQPQQPSQTAKPSAPKPSTRFERDTTLDMLKQFGGQSAAGLGATLNMYGTGGNTDAQPANGSQPPPPPPPPPGGSSRPKEAPPPPPPSSSSQQRHSSHKHASSSKQAARQPGQSGKQAAAPAPVVDPLAGAVPIIIVPSGMTAMITMYNARAFLEEGRFEPSSVAAQGGAAKPTSLVMNRTAGKPHGKPVQYLVTDKPPPKGDKDWGRVVAVIVQGAKWQFKDWPFKGADKGDMADTFHKVAGFYVHYSDDKLPDTIAGWNVKRLGLARERRHMDSPVMLDFYRHLDQFLQSRKCTLAY